MAGVNEADATKCIPGVGPLTQISLKTAELSTVHNVLENIPIRYLDTQHPLAVSQLQEGETAVVEVEVVVAKALYFGERRGSVVATVQDDTGQLAVRWFNQPYLQRRLIPGSHWTLIGPVKRVGKKFQLINPTIETERGIFPVYRPVSGVAAKTFRGFAPWCIQHVTLDSQYELPDSVRTLQGLPDRLTFLRAAHQPASAEDIRLAERYAQFAELFFFFAGQASAEASAATEDAPVITHTVSQLKGLTEKLPFPLTNAQRKALWQIVQDMGSPRPMIRLLNGDVGSGKTAVAALAAAVVAKASFRSVFLVPTEVLATQHAQSLSRLLGDQVSVAVWTATRKDDAGTADITVGTHAVLYDRFPKGNIGLVIVDEQHRFGVRQRHQLVSGSGVTPHLLTMTATPIPRTLALALFSNLQMSILDERPANRAEIRTTVVSGKEMASVHSRIVNELALSNQILIICPLISEDSEIEAPSAIAEAAKLTKQHPEYGEIGLLHGGMGAAEKQEVMQRMANNELHVLVSTTVIEVGIDLPRATVIVVLGAERFGLSQLHQLRGRVGRSERPSYCFLCPTSGKPPRLELLASSQDGFEIARADLDERGPGSLAGTLQAGLPAFERAALSNLELLATVKAIAYAYVAGHPGYSPSAYSSERVGWE